MKLICPYCESLLDIESNECCGESGHGVELLERFVYYVAPADTTPDEPFGGWYASPKYDGGKPRHFDRRRDAVEFIEDETNPPDVFEAMGLERVEFPGVRK